MANEPVDAMLDSLEWKPLEGNADGVESVSGLPYATHSAVLNIAGHELRCYMLSTGERVFDADDVREFFGGEFMPIET